MKELGRLVGAAKNLKKESDREAKEKRRHRGARKPTVRPTLPASGDASTAASPPHEGSPSSPSDSVPDPYSVVSADSKRLSTDIDFASPLKLDLSPGDLGVG